jgi:hypothetical protein
MKKSLLNSDNDCEVRILTADGHLFTQAEIPNDHCTAADSQGFLLPWNEEEESDPVVLQNVLERVPAPIARAIWDHQSTLIQYLNESRWISLGGYIHSSFPVTG